MSVDKFLIKSADLATILPSVALPAIGAFAGNKLGPAAGVSKELGTMIGAIGGGTGGQLYKETMDSRRRGVPSGAPYAIDSTSEDIPPWALQGAQLVRPAMAASATKTSAHDPDESPIGTVLGEIPGATPIYEGIKARDPRVGLKAFGGMAMGGLPAAMAGNVAAKGIEHLVGHPVTVPGLGLSLSDTLSSIGGALGASKGYRMMGF